MHVSRARTKCPVVLLITSSKTHAFHQCQRDFYCCLQDRLQASASIPHVPAKYHMFLRRAVYLF